MATSIDYTSRARKIAYRYPRLSFLGIQVNFWIIAIFLHAFITHMHTAYMGQFQEVTFPLSFKAVILTSVLVGGTLGIVLGTIDLLLIKLGFQKLSFGRMILLRIIIYPIVVLGLLLFIRFFLLDFISAFLATDYSILGNSQVSWHYFFWSLLVYIAFTAVVISFINQMNNMFGPGILIPLLLGRYRRPQEEERFFMFLDLKSSVTHAENLGHLEYSALIRDCFMDLNKVLARNNAAIYQYVGDEAVLTWPVYEATRKQACLSLFFDFEQELIQKSQYYTSHYGSVPTFKAGLHFGLVTAVEVGQIKREIAYHGDAINTAARIQSLCNQYNRSFLVSKPAMTMLAGADSKYKFEYLGEINLKGKTKATELYAISNPASKPQMAK
ncbi:adenylate/guanylate cyclase domain-containing protein [Pontibacter oryzae]|uniref:Adenylate/guanylate cyclase domain-containing protein n=1 Tax=Pontibacter oryzae TaxID=2304593 RepID=A0A399SJ31_9BACT|nr:adenylate/guanylate cyclase domain-containing protein [Pontibacter oryzae]RIJ42493.1 adenylate/guanylate cyclase domain-containing protein [Pontibacter oryzae]